MRHTLQQFLQDLLDTFPNEVHTKVPSLVPTINLDRYAMCLATLMEVSKKVHKQRQRRFQIGFSNMLQLLPSLTDASPPV